MQGNPRRKSRTTFFCCLFWDVLGHCRGATWGRCYVWSVVMVWVDMAMK